MKTLKEKIAVMQAADNGAQIECRRHEWVTWEPSTRPQWGWDVYDYRIKPAEPMRCWVRVLDSIEGDDKFGCAYATSERASAISNTRLVEFVEVVK